MTVTNIGKKSVKLKTVQVGLWIGSAPRLDANRGSVGGRFLAGVYGPDSGRHEDFTFLVRREKEQIAIFRLEAKDRKGKRQVNETGWADLCAEQKDEETKPS